MISVDPGLLAEQLAANKFRLWPAWPHAFTTLGTYSPSRRRPASPLGSTSGSMISPEE